MEHSEIRGLGLSSPTTTLADRTFISDDTCVTGKEFIRKVEALGKRRGAPVVVEATRGKGSHQTLYYGDRKTIVRNPKDELKTGTYYAMLNQLGITNRDLRK
jgi:mRNA interferase HicA